jgi:PAS domain S-box-containing protein
LLFDHSTDAILLTEPDGSILEANASACKMFGRSVEEIRKIGRSGLVDVTDPRLQAALDERAGKRSGTAEITMLRASGEKFSAEISSTLFVDKNGRQKTSMIIRDISERKQAEEDLRHERDLMARIMETSPVCITMVNSEGQITFANPGAEEVLGLSPDEVTDRTYNSPEWRITDYDGKPFPDEQLPFRQVMDTGLPTYDVRHAIEWPDGRRLLLSINGAPLLDKAGKIEGMICAIQDVTEQIETSKALKESESLYRLHFENVSDIIYWVNRELKVVNISPSVKTVLGYKPEELIGKPFQELNLLVPEYLEKAATDTMLVFDGKRIPATEYQFLTRDGTKKWGEVSGAPLIKDGQVVAVISVARDITDRKRAEQKIKDYAGNLEAMVEERTKELNHALYDTEQARDRIDGILKSVGDGLIVTDLYKRIILMNRAAEDLFGVRLSEVIDRPIDFAIKDKILRARIKYTLEKKDEGYEFDFDLPGAEGRHPRIIRGCTSLIMDKAGAYTGIITALQDVTYEREVDRMKTEFISTAAHELRTPLTSIQGFSELLITRDDIAEEEKKECLSYINAQSVNLANIINDLLDISRIESGKGFSLNKAPCTITELMRETVPYFQMHSKKHQFDLILPEEPVEVIADIDMLRQVLENILSNAVKYSPEGGTIRIIGEVVKDRYQVSIEDQGMGMSPKQVERIFDKFYRADYSNTAIPGTGLGMNIVKYLVEAHGGEVWVESTKGKGTIARFTIPFKTTKQTRKE